MTEEQKSELDILQGEYQQLCLQAGNLQYHIAVQREELRKMNGKMRRINRKAARLRETEKETQDGTSSDNVDQKDSPAETQHV